MIREGRDYRMVNPEIGRLPTIIGYEGEADILDAATEALYRQAAAVSPVEIAVLIDPAKMPTNIKEEIGQVDTKSAAETENPAKAPADNEEKPARRTRSGVEYITHTVSVRGQDEARTAVVWEGRKLIGVRPTEPGGMVIFRNELADLRKAQAKRGFFRRFRQS